MALSIFYSGKKSSYSPYLMQVPSESNLQLIYFGFTKLWLSYSFDQSRLSIPILYSLSCESKYDTEVI